MFWGDKQADELSKLFQERSVLESPQNLLSLNHQIHWWFDSAKLAFKPLRSNPSDGSVEVQFHWLKSSRLRPSQKLDLYGLAAVSRVLDDAGLESGRWGGL